MTSTSRGRAAAARRAPGVGFAGDREQRHVGADRIGAAKSADHVPVIRSPGCGIQFPARLLGLHPGPPEWHERVLGRVGQQGVHQVGGQVPLEVGVEQHVLVGHAVAQRVLPLANQRACAGRQSPLDVGDFVVVGASQPVQQLGVARRQQALPIQGPADQTPRRARLMIQDATDGRRQLRPVCRVRRTPERTDSPAMWSSVSATTTGERRRRWNRARSGQCMRQLPGPRGSPQEPQAAGPAASTRRSRHAPRTSRSACAAPDARTLGTGPVDGRSGRWLRSGGRSDRSGIRRWARSAHYRKGRMRDAWCRHRQRESPTSDVTDARLPSAEYPT